MQNYKEVKCLYSSTEKFSLNQPLSRGSLQKIDRTECVLGAPSTEREPLIRVCVEVFVASFSWQMVIVVAALCCIQRHSQALRE